MEIISSLSNSKVKYWSSLLQKKYRDIEGVYLVEGEHLVLEAIRKNLVVEIIACEDYQVNYLGDIYYVTYDILKKISKVETPQKVMAVIRKKEFSIIGNKVLVLDRVQDPGNLGTIIRSAVAFNIDTIILSEDSVDLYNEKVIRSTEGMLFNINVLRKDLKSFIPKLKEDNYKIVGTRLTSGMKVKDYIFPKRVALVMGNEGNGISSEVLSLCDDFVYVPMNEVCESLNVGVAASILMYEMEKQNE